MVPVKFARRLNGLCDGAGSCALYDMTTVCGAPTCIGAESRPLMCAGGLGSCAPSASGTSCAPYKCQASSGLCLHGCSADTDCLAGNYCDGSGACAAKHVDGGACAAGNECLGAHCADGVCCDTACAGTCDACTAAKKGSGSDGVCGAIGSGTDPDDECTAAPKSSCGNDGWCDGNHACAPWPSGTDCSAVPGSNVCNGNRAVGMTCYGPGDCRKNTSGIDCGLRKCVAGECAACTTADDCFDPSASYCAPGGDCVARQAQGSSCTGNAQCLSGACFDGVCCASACNGTCEWCGDTSQPGVCVVVSAAKQPEGQGKAPCSGTGPCAGACDGQRRDGCTYPGASTVCEPGRCLADWSVPSSTCDQTGGCTVATTQPQPCGDYTCGATGDAGTGCKTTCTSDQDCRAGAVCNTSTGGCSASGVTCDGAYSVKSPGGTVTPCPGGYRCTAGQCQAACSAPTDCNQAGGWSCAGGLCVPGDAGVSDAATTDAPATESGTGTGPGVDATIEAAGGSGGADADAASASESPADAASSCGCRVPGGGSSDGAPVGLLVLGAAAAMMRGRRRRTARHDLVDW